MLPVAAPPRPKRYSVQVKTMAVQAHRRELEEWLERALAPSDIEQLINEFDEDGFEFAKNLERYGWDADAALVELLGGITLHSSHDKLVAAWVTYFDVKTPFEKGEWVSTPKYPAAQIYEVRRQTAELIIQPLNHPDWDPVKHKTGGIIVPVESASIIAAPDVNQLTLDVNLTEAKSAGEELA